MYSEKAHTKTWHDPAKPSGVFIGVPLLPSERSRDPVSHHQEKARRPRRRHEVYREITGFSSLREKLPCCCPVGLVLGESCLLPL